MNGRRARELRGAGLGTCRYRTTAGVTVLPTLQVVGRPEVYVVVDDLAYVEEQGRPLPMVAPVANQQGTAVARARGTLDLPST